MFINELHNTKNLHSVVIQELRSHGVKYRLKKSNNKNVQGSGGALFGAPVQSVPQQTVQCCGTTFQIPAFLHEACCFLRASVHFEGLFRKAGSQSRQRDIKRLLDTGCKIDKSYHAVDIAGILKLYLRSLPEPLLGHDIQEVLLRCLLLSDSLKLSALQNALLLLPTLYLDVLHYIMEFFRYVSSKSEVNKMDSNNLAIVLTPSIMPLPVTSPPQRMEQHVKLVKILIENANVIGRVSLGLAKHLEEDLEKEEEKTRKKRRSGSLTRMLNGLRKIVSGNSVHQHKPTTPDFLATPVLDKCAAKRKQESHLGLSAKKRMEILNGLPQQPLCTPIRSLGEKEYKKLRLSIGRKPKDRCIDYKMAVRQNLSDLVLNEPKDDKKINAIGETKSDLIVKNKENDFVTISKSEYEAIKKRVSAIEIKISEEFDVIKSMEGAVESVKQVQSAYEKTCEEAANLTSPTAEQLAKRLSRELKIRRSNEHKIMRSPSARKIGTIRRRSRENVTKLKRTQTWNASSHTGITGDSVSNDFPAQANLKRGRPNTINTGLIQPFPNENNSIIKRRVSVAGMNEVNSAFNTSARSYSTRIQLKRTSIHGVPEQNSPQAKKDIKFNSSNEVSWKNAKSFLSSVENLENHLTGRASVAKLRSQNAGMVLAKARLFDGMTDSDTSVEKKVANKPAKHTSFARKPRKMINETQSKHVFNSTDETDMSSSLTDKNMRKDVKSPSNVSKRPKPKLTRSPVNITSGKENLNLSSQLKDVIYDVCTPMSEKICTEKTPSKVTIKVNSCRTPRLSTPAKKITGVKSSCKNLTHNRNFKSTISNSGDCKRQNTPLRAIHPTPRKSPRLTNMKSRLNN